MSRPGGYQFPQVSAPLPAGERGIATLRHPAVGGMRFRCNPNEFNWSYTLNKRVDQTYGGRVVQLLGTRIDDFSMKADCGTGRWAYMAGVARFMRDIMVAQRGGVPATFEYTTRGWKFNAYVVNVPFADAVEEVVREFDIQMKVQEDVTGVMSRNTLSAELRRLQDGIAFARSKYNDPRFGRNEEQSADPDSGPLSQILPAVEAVTDFTATLAQNFLPNGLEGFLGGGGQDG